MIDRPKEEQVIDFLKTYVNEVVSIDLLKELNNNMNRFLSFIKSIPEDNINYSYAEGKWSVIELI